MSVRGVGASDMRGSGGGDRPRRARRSDLAGAVLLAWLIGGTAMARPAQSEQPATAVNRIADELYALSSGRIAEGALPDNSDAARREREKAEDRLYTGLMSLDAKALSGPDLVTFRMLRETLEADRGLRICRRELWNIDHINGWHIRLGSLAERQPVGSPEARATALLQWRRLPDFVATEIARLETGLKSGYSAPRAIVSRVITQLDALLAVPLETSSFMSPTRRDPDPRFASDLRALIASDVYPALQRYRTFLRETYLPQARSSLGISSLPDGQACYRALLRHETTLEASPREIFERGRKMVAANRAEIIELGSEVFGTRDFDAIMRRLAEDPANKFGSPEEVLQFSRDTVQSARKLSAAVFPAQPEAELQIVAFPDYQRNTGMNPYYSPATEAGRPARYLINLETWRDNSKGQAEVASIHEAWPGHHLQVSLARALPHRNSFTAHAHYAAYIEGWARYVERLADETGMYATAYARITWRAKPGFGMVVDPGLHAFGWSRERAADFLRSSGLFSSDQAIQDMIDRIAVMPAQLTAYDTGGSEFLRLREQARRKLGKAFDLRAFHQQVLGVGFVPLSVLRESTTAWIEQQSASRESSP